MRRRQIKPSREVSGTRRAFILVEALLVIAGIVALMAIFAAHQRASLAVVQTRLRQRRADAAVQSALARTLAVLASVDENHIALTDDWALLGDQGNQLFDLRDSTFRMQIVDAGAMVDINTANQQQLQMLPMTQEMIDCLLDWRETGRSPRPDGAKDDYYLGLPQPYNTKLGTLTNVNELLLIKGWTAKALYQPPENTFSSAPLPEDTNGNVLPLAYLLTTDSGAPNRRANGQARLNLNQRNLNIAQLTRLGITPQLATQIAQRAPIANFRALFALPGMNAQMQQLLLDAVTFSTATREQGKINLNTASQAALQTVPNITQEIATSIVSRQSTGLASLGDLATIPGVSGQTLAQIASEATVGSDTWILRAYGESGGTGMAIEAVIRITNGQPQVESWECQNTSGIPVWWNWQEQTTSTIDAGASQ